MSTLFFKISCWESEKSDENICSVIRSEKIFVTRLLFLLISRLEDPSFSRWSVDAKRGTFWKVAKYTIVTFFFYFEINRFKIISFLL